MRNRVVGAVLSLIGGMVGGTIGYWAFFWIVRQGFYALILPGAFLGLGCSLPARQRSLARGSACGVAALVLGLYTDWGYEQFQEDKSFAYFATHIQKLEPITLIMIAAGALLAFWLGKESGYFSRPELPPVDRQE